MEGGIGTRKHVQQLPLPARDVVLRQGLGELLVNQLVEKFEPETDGLRRGHALLLSGPPMDGAPPRVVQVEVRGMVSSQCFCATSSSSPSPTVAQALMLLLST